MKRKVINNAMAIAVASTMTIGGTTISKPVMVSAAELEATKVEEKSSEESEEKSSEESNIKSSEESSDVSIDVVSEIVSDWGTGYNFDITITNTGSTPIENWSVEFKTDDKVSSLWNAGAYTISSDGKQSKVSHPTWDNTLEPGESFKIGGGATRITPNGKIYDVVINGDSTDGEPINPVDPIDPVDPVDPIDPIDPEENQETGDISTRFEITSDWGTGYSFELYVTNKGDSTIENWAIDFDFDDTVENVWEAGSYTNSGSHTTAFAPSWATSIKPNETVKIGGMARRTTNGNQPYNIALLGNAINENNNNGGGTDNGNNNGDGTVTDAKYPDYSKVDVGVGKDWGDTFYSPFVDSTLWYNKPGYSGLYPIADEAQYSQANLVNLGFIVANSKNQPSWGGYYDVDGSDPIIQKSYDQIKELRENGGDVLVSFGGENGVPLHQAIKDTDELAQQYINFVTAFGLKNIDFDIEGGAVRDKEAWQRNNDAIKIMQDTLGEDAPAVWFTFPTLPTGLVGEGTGNDAYNILQDAVNKGVDVRGVNIMTMCFGANAVKDPSDMSVPVIQASEALKEQIQEIYANAGITLTDEEAYRKVGITPMIGVSYQAQEVFELEDAQKVVDYANEKGIGMLSFWSLTRDKTGPNGDLANGTQIPQSDYAFSKIFAQYNN